MVEMYKEMNSFSLCFPPAVSMTRQQSSSFQVMVGGEGSLIVRVEPWLMG